ncbi:MAG: PTS sugar transporter subunit IIA [Spirochaetes bacterium]|nr:PTS sugar transporter subunit IIA [Spirochaetota bacterium]
MLSIINENLVIINDKCKNKNTLLEDMVELLHKQNRISDKKLFLKEIMDREKIQSTGIGENIAIPHAKSETVRIISVVIAICRNGINFKSLDNKPVKIVFLVAAPKDFVKVYLQMIAKIARILKHAKWREEFLKAGNNEKVISLIRDFDKEYPDRLNLKLDKENILYKE